MTLSDSPLNASRVPCPSAAEAEVEVRLAPRLGRCLRSGGPRAADSACQFFRTTSFGTDTPGWWIQVNQGGSSIYLTVTEIRAPSAPFDVAITLAVPGRRPVMRPVAASSAITLESVFEP